MKSYNALLPEKTKFQNLRIGENQCKKKHVDKFGLFSNMLAS